MTLDLLADSGTFVVGRVVSIVQRTGGGSVWCFFASWNLGGSHHILHIVERRSVGAICSYVAVRLAMKELRNFSTFARFLNFYYCVKDKLDIENILVGGVRLEVEENNMGRAFFDRWCLIFVTCLVNNPISSIAEEISVTGVERWRFLKTTL